MRHTAKSGLAVSPAKFALVVGATQTKIRELCTKQASVHQLMDDMMRMSNMQACMLYLRGLCQCRPGCER